jgi:hypothetical protein
MANLSARMVPVPDRELISHFSHPLVKGAEFSSDDVKAVSKAVFMADESVFLIDHKREDHVVHSKLSRRLMSDPGFQGACRRKDRDAQMVIALKALKIEQRIDFLQVLDDLGYEDAEQLAKRDLRIAAKAVSDLKALAEDPGADVSAFAKELHAARARGDRAEKPDLELALLLIDRARHPEFMLQNEDTTPIQTPSPHEAAPTDEAKAVSGTETATERIESKAPMEKPDLGEELYDDVIRGPELEVLIRSSHGANMDDAIKKAESNKRAMSSNLLIDSALVESQRWRAVESGLSCWTGTMAAYEAPNVPFGPYVEFTDPATGLRYVLKVPEKYMGVKNGVLVAEHPYFTIDAQGNDRIVHAARLDLIERFPSETMGWYLTDPQHGIPFGDQVDRNLPGARYPWRVGKRVGLIARDSGALKAGPRSVLLNIKPSSAVFGVIVEASIMEPPL